jgi:hypothetical protein
MTGIIDMFDPEVLFSKENPFLKYSGKTHHLIFAAFDKTARLQLSFFEDLVNMNRTRFHSLYAGDSLTDKIAAHQELGTEMGKRTATWAGDLQEVIIDLQSGVINTAIGLFMPAAAKGKAATSS